MRSLGPARPDTGKAVKAAYAGVGSNSRVDFDAVYRRAARKKQARRVSRLVPLAAAALLVLTAIPLVNRRIEERRLLEEAIAYQTELIFSSTGADSGLPGAPWIDDPWSAGGTDIYFATASGEGGSWWLSPVDSQSY